MVDLLQFSQVLRRLRNAHQLSQTQLAERVGTVQTVISNWEHGTTRPSVDQSFLIERVFWGVPNGILTGYLGYQPFFPDPDPVLSGADYLALDQALEQWEFDALLIMYFGFKGGVKK